MGIQSYKFPVDFFNNLENPVIFIADKYKEILNAVAIYEGLKITCNLNAFQTAEFKIFRDINGEKQDYFKDFEEGMLILIPGIAWYEIHVETNIDNTGISKTISATSLECKLCDKRLVDFQVNSDDFEDDDYVVTTFYNPTEPKKSLLHRILNVTPNWTVGHVDQSLVDKQRTFNEDDVNVYSFLTETVAEAFNCLFTFDTFNQTVNAYDLDTYGNDTNIFVSMDNLAQNMSETIEQRSIFTCYRVKGGDGVYINEVNPNGTDKIYNFDYYLSHMPTELQAKVTAYNSKYQSLKPQYENVVARLQTQLEKIHELYDRVPDSLASTDWTKFGLELLESQEKSLKTLDELYCAQGYNIPSDIHYDLYRKNHQKLNDVQAEIAVRESEIESAKNEYNTIYSELTDIHKQLNMAEWFTEDEWKILDDYVIEETYTNDNFSVTDNTDEAELFSMEKELYDKACEDLSKKCRPQYQYSATLANLLTIPEFKDFVKYFELGNFIRMETDYDIIVKLRLISFTVDYTNTQTIDVTFSDAVRVKNALEDHASILAQANSLASSFKFRKDQYDNSVKQGNWVSEVRKYGLDVATTQIRNATDQSQTWDETGMTFRKWNDERQDFDPEMIKIINNMMVFSDDGFDTTKMAIGKIALGNGEYAYGINAEVLLSKLIMSENLWIENDSGTYKFTDDGFNASNGTNEIKIQPNNSGELFSIYKGSDKKFYITSDGDPIFKGGLEGATGTFSGLLKGGSIDIGNGTFTVDSNGNMIAKSGTFVGNGDGLTFESNATINNMSSSITQNADAIQTEVSNRQSADNEMSSKIAQTSEEIRTEVSNRQNADSELSSLISQTSEEIKSEVIRAINAESMLSSSISQTADSISAEVSARENADSLISASLDLKINRYDDGTIISLINGSANRINFNATNMFTVDSPNFKVDAAGNVKSISGEFVSATFKNTIFYGLDYNGQSVYFPVIDVPQPGYITFGLTNSHTTFPGSVQFDGYLHINKPMAFGSSAYTKGTSTGTTNSLVYKVSIDGVGGDNDIPSANWVKNYVAYNSPTVDTSNFAPSSHSHDIMPSKISPSYGSGTHNFMYNFNAYSGKNGFSYTYGYASGSLSDERLKENIKPIEDISDKYMQLVPIQFNFHDDIGCVFKGTHFGFIAQDVERIFDDDSLAIICREHQEDESANRYLNGDDAYILDKDELHALHVQMIQKQQREIESLKHQNVSLEGRIAILEQQNQHEIDGLKHEVNEFKQEVADLKQLVNKLLERDSV